MESRRIQLANGGFTTVDADDYEALSKFRWFGSHQGYAIRQGWERKPTGEKEHWYIFMHRVVNKTPDGLYTDHINGHKLDNRKANLRTTDKSRNGANRPKPKTARGRKQSSQFKGVRFNRLANLWEARISNRGKDRTTYHRTEEQAALDYNRMASESFGEFAAFNAVPEGTSPTVRKPKGSKFRGVCYRKRTGKWYASIEIGEFATELEAAQAYNKVCAWLRGPLAILNAV
jgi:hypothetical protein